MTACALERPEGPSRRGGRSWPWEATRGQRDEVERALPWREAAPFFLLSASGHGSCVSGLFRFVLFIVGSERSGLVKTEGTSAGAEAEKGEDGEREGFFVF